MLLLSALTAAALACDGACTHVRIDGDEIVVDSHEGCDPCVVIASDDDDDDDDRHHGREKKPHDKGYVALRGDWLDLGDRSAWGGQLRSQGRKDGWFGVEGRLANDGAWMGRGTLGADLFGRSAIDLGLGIVAGQIGDWQTADNRRFSIGTELVVGWHPGRLMLEHRHLGGKRPEGRGIRTESHTMIGFRPAEPLEVYLDLASIDPGGEAHELGIGGGLGLRF